jgi:hypothetical protein
MRHFDTVYIVAQSLKDTATKLRLNYPSVEGFLDDLPRLPRPVDEWLVRNQLRNSPRVEALWR